MMTVRKTIFLCAILAVAIWFAACSDDSTDPGSGTPDTTAPEVVGTEPNNAGIGVSWDDSVFVLFSEPMDPDSAEGQVTLSAGANLGFTWYSDRMLVIGHDDWTDGTEVTCTIGAGLADEAGNTLAAAYVFSFLTESFTELVVVSHTPADGATAVNRDAGIILQFSSSLNSGDLYSHVSISLPMPVKKAPPFTIDTLDDGLFLLNYYSTFPENTLITVTVAAGLESYSGLVLADDYAFTFTTGTAVDTTPPTIVSFTPANGNTSVSPDVGFFRVTFSEPINPDTFYPRHWSLGLYLKMMMQEYVDPIWSEGGTVVTIPLAGGLPTGLPMSMTFAYFEDLAGNEQETETVWTARVSGTVDYVPVVDGTRYMDDVEWAEGVAGNDEPVSTDNETRYFIQEVQTGDEYHMVEYDYSDFVTATGNWDAFRKTSSALQWAGFEEVDSGPTKANMFDSPLDILPLPIAVGNWTDETTVTVAGDGTYRATVNGTVLGKADYEIPESEGEVFIMEAWTVYRRMTVEYQDGADWFPAFTQSDTVWYAPSLGDVKTYSHEVEEEDGSWTKSYTWHWDITTMGSGKAVFKPRN